MRVFTVNITTMLFIAVVSSSLVFLCVCFQHRPSNLRAKLSQVKFWKRQESGADKYEVSMGPDGESVA